jgi:hypothetical protein
MKRLYYPILILLLFALLPACGSSTTAAKSGGSIKAVIKPSALAVGQNVAGIQLAITIPAGVSPILNSDGTVNMAGTVEITGSVPQNQTLPGAAFTPATATSAGQLIIVGVEVAGFKATDQDQIIIHLNVAVDSFPVETDFKLLSFAAFDTNGKQVDGLNPVLTANIQF